MNVTPDSLVTMAGGIAIALILMAFVLATWRVIRGPTLADRVLGLDLLVVLVIGFIAAMALTSGQTVYVDIALALGLVGFLATTAFARFILSRADGRRPVDWPKAPKPVPAAKRTVRDRAARASRKGGRHV